MITYPGTGQTSTFTYDALGRNVKIVEAGSTSGTKQFVWCAARKCEERDGSGVLTRQFFSRGETVSGTAYFWSMDHLGSVREMMNNSGSIVWQQSFDPNGVATSIVSTMPADFGYAAMYLHLRSGLNLTWFREYKAQFGRWLSRDPIGEFPEEVSGSMLQRTDTIFVDLQKFGTKLMTASSVFRRSELAEFGSSLVAPHQVNLYNYCANDPINRIDWSGKCFTPRTAPPTVNNTSPTLAPPPPQGYGNPGDDADPGAPKQLVPGPQSEPPPAAVPGATPTPPGTNTGF